MHTATIKALVFTYPPALLTSPPRPHHLTFPSHFGQHRTTPHHHTLPPHLTSHPTTTPPPRLTSPIDFFQHINLVYGTVCEFCTMGGCPDMTGPATRQYLWFDEKGKKTRVAAPQYVDYVMTFTQKTINDESIFPTKFVSTTHMHCPTAVTQNAKPHYNNHSKGGGRQHREWDGGTGSGSPGATCLAEHLL
ncbi:MOB kinase activator-like 2 [Portunus trituberculatus]|uniref:MOB kinase activator-like 2 n=1 Tax=Portunus trituberculatus TaxID=210409 RepID=A0A5B7DBM5_PORTR|nr:MOB kinase activator-like 2 [Portunus trituberculatus]